MKPGNEFPEMKTGIEKSKIKLVPALDVQE